MLTNREIAIASVAVGTAIVLIHQTNQKINLLKRANAAHSTMMFLDGFRSGWDAGEAHGRHQQRFFPKKTEETK